MKMKSMKLNGMEDLSKVLKEMMGNEEQDYVMSELGIVPQEILDEMKQLERDDEDLKDEISSKLDEIAKQVRREYDDRVEEMENRDDALWKKIYAHVGDDGEGDRYKLNRKTGMVTRKISPMSTEESTRLFQ